MFLTHKRKNIFLVKKLDIKNLSFASIQIGLESQDIKLLDLLAISCLHQNILHYALFLVLLT